MSDESVIHIRLDYIEALQAKKGILSSQLSAMGIARKIARYREGRVEELEIKSRLHGKIKELKANIRKLQSILPNPKVPRMAKHEEKEMEKQLEKENMVRTESDIESQLREIQRRLERLQRNT